MGAVGKADHRAGLHLAAAEQLHHQGHVSRPGADGGGVVLQGDIAALADILLRQEGLQGGMVQGLGDFAQGDGHKRFSFPYGLPFPEKPSRSGESGRFR